MSDGIAFEIERRFLIAVPDERLLSKAGKSDIVQTYLLNSCGCTERVRKRAYSDRVVYTHTVKRRCGDIRREENEREISLEKYTALLERADSRRRPVAKSRYCIEYCGKTLEIDIFPFWNDRAILEIELNDEADELHIPGEITVIREISLDKRYTNASLALEVPYEQL